MRSSQFRCFTTVLATLAALSAAATAKAAPPPTSPASTTTTAMTNKKPAPKPVPTATVPTNPPPHSSAPSTNQPFPTSTNVSNFSAGQITVRVKFNDTQISDGGWAHYTLYVANRTPKTMLFTTTGVAVGLDGRAWSWSQTADNTGGFGFADAGHYWLRSGTLRPGRVIKITGKVQAPKRTKYVSGNPLRDANLACIQAKVRETNLGQEEKSWPVTRSKVDRYSCAQYSSS
jgi:hypothetical protein